MKLKSLAALTLLLSTWIVTAPAHADTVLYDGTGFVVGTQSFVQSFNLSTPGTLEVTLTNVAWPEQLASLNMLLGSASGAMGPEMGAGTASFKVKAGDVFAQWFGTAQGTSGRGRLLDEDRLHSFGSNRSALTHLPGALRIRAGAVGLVPAPRECQPRRGRRCARPRDGGRVEFSRSAFLSMSRDLGAIGTDRRSTVE